MKKYPFNRREFFGFAAAGAAFAAMGDASAEELPPIGVRGSYFEPMRDRYLAAGAKADKFGNLRGLVACRYRTDPERIARVLPPHLEPDDDPVVMLDWFMILSHPEVFVAFVPGWTYGEADLFVSCKFEGHRCMLPLALILEQDFGRYAGREGQSLRKKDGQVNIDVTGSTVRAWTTRKGKLVSAIETEFTDEPATPAVLDARGGLGLDARRLPPPPGLAAGSHRGGRGRDLAPLRLRPGLPDGFARRGATGTASATGVRRVRRPRSSSGDDPLTPFGEFPVREILGVSFGIGGGEGSDTREPAGVPRGPTTRWCRRGQLRALKVATCPGEDYERWAIRRQGLRPAGVEEHGLGARGLAGEDLGRDPH